MKKLSFSDKSILYIASNIIQSGLTLVWGMFLVRYMTKYEYGTFQQIMLLRSTIISASAVGLPQSLLYFIPRASNLEEKKRFIVQTFFYLTSIGVTVALSIFLFRDNIGNRFNNPLLAEYAGIYTFFFLLIFPSMIADAMFISMGKIYLASILSILFPVILFLNSVVPLVLGYGFKMVLIGILFAFIIKFLIVLIYILRIPATLRNIFNLKDIKEQIKYSFPLGLATIVGILQQHLDKLFISLFFLPQDFAVYSRGAFELPFVAILPYAMSNLLLPKFAKSYKENDKETMLYHWNEAIRKIALIFFPLFIFTFIFADKLITLLFTTKYEGSVMIFRVYLCLLPFRLAGYRGILQAIGETKPIFNSALLSLIINAILNLILINLLGFIGPAISAVISELVGIGYMLYFTVKKLNLSLSRIFPWKDLYLILFVSLLVGIFVFPFVLIDSSRLLSLMSGSFVFFSIYIVIAKKFKALNNSDWDLITRWATLKVFK